MHEPPAKRCVRCGYILEQLPEPRCPECGLEFDPRWPETYFAGQHIYPGWKFLLAAALAPLGAILAAMLTRPLQTVVPWLASVCFVIGLEIYVAVRSGQELAKPRSLRERRICWLGALLLSLGILLLCCAIPASCMLTIGARGR